MRIYFDFESQWPLSDVAVPQALNLLCIAGLQLRP